MLIVEDLRVRYTPGGPWALDGVDLKVQPGEFIAILGRSGAGKSTLIRCLNRLVTPTSGSIVWEGRDVLALGPRELRAHRRRIGMIFQEFHLIDRLSVLGNVLVGRFGAMPWPKALLGRFSAEDLQLAQQALERVGLAAFSHRRVSTLSGGQRQRVAIARALVQQPRMILGDEPVSNLDPATSVSILSLLEQINREDGITLLINLHSVELARRYARRIIGMADGRIVFDAGPEALTAQALEKIYGPFDDQAFEEVAGTRNGLGAGERNGSEDGPGMLCAAGGVLPPLEGGRRSPL